MSRNSQVKEVLEYTTRHGSITSMEAFGKLGITRLADVIYKLEKKDIHFRREAVTERNRYGNTVTYTRYHIERETVSHG